MRVLALDETERVQADLLDANVIQHLGYLVEEGIIVVVRFVQGRFLCRGNVLELAKQRACELE